MNSQNDSQLEDCSLNTFWPSLQSTYSFCSSRNVMVLIIISMIANKFHFAGQLLFSLSRESNIVLFMGIQWKEALKKTCK